jgi:hypothetical protein
MTATSSAATSPTPVTTVVPVSPSRPGGSRAAARIVGEG